MIYLKNKNIIFNHRCRYTKVSGLKNVDIINEFCEAGLNCNDICIYSYYDKQEKMVYELYKNYFQEKEYAYFQKMYDKRLSKKAI